MHRLPPPATVVIQPDGMDAYTVLRRTLREGLAGVAANGAVDPLAVAGDAPRPALDVESA